MNAMDWVVTVLWIYGITTLGILTWRGRWSIEIVHVHPRPADRWTRGRQCRPWGAGGDL